MSNKKLYILIALLAIITAGSSFAITSGTPGSIIFAKSNGEFSQDNSALNWNDSGGALSIGSIVNLVTYPGTLASFTGAGPSGGTITVTNSNMAATSNVIISLNAQGGTISTPPAMKTVTASTGFTVLCATSDTSTYNYLIMN